jgi:hypothetical protein
MPVYVPTLESFKDTNNGDICHHQQEALLLLYNMDTNLGLSAFGTFNLVYSDKTDGSKRAKTGTSPGLSHALTVKHTEFVDGSTKVKFRRSLVRFDQNIVIDAVGTIAPVSAYLVVATPLGSVDISAAVNNNVYALSMLLATAAGVPNANMLGLSGPIFVTGEQ